MSDDSTIIYRQPQRSQSLIQKNLLCNKKAQERDNNQFKDITLQLLDMV